MLALLCLRGNASRPAIVLPCIWTDNSMCVCVCVCVCVLCLWILHVRGFPVLFAHHTTALGCTNLAQVILIILYHLV